VEQIVQATEPELELLTAFVGVLVEVPPHGTGRFPIALEERDPAIEGLAVVSSEPFGHARRG
jgi:hypothetical protein